MSKTPQCSSFYRLFYVLYSRSTDSYCCHMPWQVTGDSSLHTLFHTIPPLMSLWLKGINSRNPILWESVFLLIVFRFTWLKWMFDLQVNVFVMFCCNNYKSIDNPLTIHWQSIDKSIVHNCGVEWRIVQNTCVHCTLWCSHSWYCYSSVNIKSQQVCLTLHNRYLCSIFSFFAGSYARRDDEKGVKKGWRSAPSQECAKQKR